MKCLPLPCLTLAVLGADWYSASTSLQPPQPLEQAAVTERHPAFMALPSAEWPADAEATAYRCDGFVLPVRFTVNITAIGEAKGRALEAGFLEFVLVRPTSLAVTGATLRVERPFYMATTELTNAQRGVLEDSPLDRYESYDEYVEQYYWHVRTGNPYVDGEQLDRLGKYLQQPSHPAISMGIGDALGCARTLSLHTGLACRLPTVAEWFVAMRAGAETRFWFGDSPFGVDLALQSDGRTARSTDTTLLRDVSAGPANAFGLKNVIGNAKEIVWPSETERLEIGRVLRDLEGARLLPTSALCLGGDANSGSSGHGGDREAARILAQQLLEWDYVAATEQVGNWNSWGFSTKWMAGVRLCIAIEPR